MNTHRNALLVSRLAPLSVRANIRPLRVPMNNYHQVTAVHEVMHTMKTNLANIKNVLHAWDRPLMERKPKPVDRDEFERAHKAIKSSRYAEIKEGGKVRLLLLVL